MKFFKRLIILLIIGIIIAMGYVIYKNNLFGLGGSSNGPNTAGDDRERNLDWLDDIRGYSDEDEAMEEEDTATSTEEIDEDSTTSTEDGDETGDGLTEDENGLIDEDRERGVENLGKADALESTVYDHAFDKLVLFAELRSSGVALEWEPTESASFDEYKIVRSTTDENPYYPKTSAIKTLTNIESTTYFDSGVEPGEDYYYRICFTKTSGRPGCGNILKVSF